jgi:polyisoprenoid-binding protein YceI
MTSPENSLRRAELAGVWELLADRSTVQVKNKTLWGAATVTGTFDDVSGSGRLAEDGTVSGRVDVRAASIRTGIGKRDQHLRSADFFDADRFGDIGVVVTSGQMTGLDQARLRAELTVRDITRPIELPVTIRILDGETVQVCGSATVDRKAFSVTGNMIGMVGSTATIVGDLVFRRATG